MPRSAAICTYYKRTYARVRASLDLYMHTYIYRCHSQMGPREGTYVGCICVYVNVCLFEGEKDGENGGGGPRTDREKSKTTVEQEPADMGETRVKDEDTGMTREPRAHINLLNRTSASSLPLNLVRSRAHFISRVPVNVGKRGASLTRTHRRRRLRQIGKLHSLALLSPRFTFLSSTFLPFALVDGARLSRKMYLCEQTIEGQA